MASDELIASWARATRSLRAALELVGPDPEVDDHLDHNELGLALDGLVDAGAGAPSEFWSLLRDAVVEMKLAADDPVHGASVREIERR